MDCLLCSAAILHAAARLERVEGLSANCFQDERHCWSVVFHWARASAGTLPVTQASYLSKKSSHSATPILPPLAVVVVVAGVVVVVAGVAVVVVVAGVLVVVVVVVLFALVWFEPLVVVSDPPQPISRNALATESVSETKNLLHIKSSPYSPAREAG
jgi:hypothetical protein